MKLLTLLQKVSLDVCSGKKGEKEAAAASNSDGAAASSADGRLLLPFKVKAPLSLLHDAYVFCTTVKDVTSKATPRGRNQTKAQHKTVVEHAADDVSRSGRLNGARVRAMALEGTHGCWVQTP